MPTFNDELKISLSGNWSQPGPSIGTESLRVLHSENGLAPAVSFANYGGGYFLQQYVFGPNANLPNGVAASLLADWHGLTITANSGAVFAIGPSGSPPNVVTGQFVFEGGDLHATRDLLVDQLVRLPEPGGIIAIGGNKNVDHTLEIGQISISILPANWWIPTQNLTGLYITNQSIDFADGTGQTKAVFGSGPQGVVGPAGPVGPAGAAGKPGSAGPSGASATIPSYSVCGQTPCSFACGSGLSQSQAGPCSLSSSAGSCAALLGGYCCVCGTP